MEQADELTKAKQDAERYRAALARIEQEAERAIDRYGILKQPDGPPEAWTTRINAVLESVAPLRDIARAAINNTVYKKQSR